MYVHLHSSTLLTKNCEQVLFHKLFMSKKWQIKIYFKVNKSSLSLVTQINQSLKIRKILSNSVSPPRTHLPRAFFTTLCTGGGGGGQFYLVT